MPMDDKGILQYLLLEGYATKKMIVGHVQANGGKGGSTANIQHLLKKLSDNQLLAHKDFYEQDNKCHVYHLTRDGLKHLGVERTEITVYKKQLQRIPIQHMEHYFLVRRLEKALHLYVDSIEYFLESCNEFNHDSRLSIKDCYIRSDGEIRIFYNESERLALRVEMDTGKESVNRHIRDKFDNYAKYLKSSRVNQEYKTWPLYILFITPKTHINAVIGKLGRHELMPYILFMPLERLQNFTLDPKWIKYLNDQKIIAEMRKKIRQGGKYLLSTESSGVEVVKPGHEWRIIDSENHVQYLVQNNHSKQKHLIVKESVDLFKNPVLSDYRGSALSLVNLIEERHPLLKLKNAVEEAAREQYDYEFRMHTMFSTPHCDPFFPMLISQQGRSNLWDPHGYVKIRKKFSDNSLQDMLFALIISLPNVHGELCEFLQFYETFLSDKTFITKVAEWPVSYGLLVLAENESRVDEFLEVHLKIINRTRIILLKDCIPERILEKPVWRKAENGSYLTLIK